VRYALALLAAVSLLAGGATAAAGAPARPALLTADDSTAFAVRPSSITLAADGGALLGKLLSGPHRGYLRWSYWSSRSAGGTATYWFKTCLPNCQQSPLQLRHVRVLAFSPKHGHFSWLRLRMHFRGQLWTERLYCQRAGGLWSWVTPDGFVKGP
jgi:hypothetical protein